MPPTSPAPPSRWSRRRLCRRRRWREARTVQWSGRALGRAARGTCAWAFSIEAQATTLVLRQRNARRFGQLRGVGKLQVLAVGGEAAQRSHDAIRECLAAGVEAGDPVVVGLPGERDAILGAGQLFGERRDRFVGLQLGIRLDDCGELAERAVQSALGAEPFAQGLGILRLLGGLLELSGGLIAG